jgi:DNA-binding HxlR family transcriptional regulator/peroxiredoxin
VRYRDLTDADCAIAQALAIVGDWWTLLVVRDVAGGRVRFDELQRELAVSRKVLAERLASLVEHGVLEKRLYSERPPRHEYHLTAKGRGLLPVLVALQDWGARHVMGDGSLSATTAPASTEAERVRGLAGVRVPPLRLAGADGERRDPLAPGRWTVLYCFPGAYAPAPGAYPPGWSDIPGAAGCTVESCAFRDRLDAFHERGAEVAGVSTQRPDELARFAAHARIPFPLLSDAELALAAALRLPTFRAAGADRLKRLTLVADPDRVVRAVLYPVSDPAACPDEALAVLDELIQRRRAADRLELGVHLAGEVVAQPAQPALLGEPGGGEHPGADGRGGQHVRQRGVELDEPGDERGDHERAGHGRDAAGTAHALEAPAGDAF